MNWVYVWMAGYGVLCIILFMANVLALIIYFDWVTGGGWTRLDQKLHPKRTERERLLKGLEE